MYHLFKVVLMLSAVLFVVIGFPLHYSLAVVPAILLLVSFRRTLYVLRMVQSYIALKKSVNYLT